MEQVYTEDIGVRSLSSLSLHSRTLTDTEPTTISTFVGSCAQVKVSPLLLPLPSLFPSFPLLYFYIVLDR